MPTTRQAGKSRGEIDKIKKTAVSTRVAKKPGKKPVKPVAAGKAVVRPSKPATPTAKKIAKAKPGTQTKKGMEQKPKKLAPKPAKLPSKPVPKKKKEEEPEEEADEEEEERRLAAYLVQQRQTAVSEFRKCIASMKREKVTEVMATDHPSYDLRLGVIKHNGPATAKIHSPACGDGSFQGYAWSTQTEPFFCDCWAEAGGLTSGCRFVTFQNGIGDLCDLATRTSPPEGSLSFEP
mmetsp:Transcript_10672/g.25148  ORF Transcript_10672/g.25148 Transcript_10672/m.25148 type:complete len:235 (+) Transcript_10672:97-801(+)